MKLFRNVVNFLEKIADKIDPHPAMPTGPVVVNVSPETSEWNRKALELAWTPGNGIIPIQSTMTAEDWKKKQEQTFRDNQAALDYAARANRQY